MGGSNLNGYWFVLTILAVIFAVAGLIYAGLWYSKMTILMTTGYNAKVMNDPDQCLSERKEIAEDVKAQQELGPFYEPGVKLISPPLCQ